MPKDYANRRQKTKTRRTQNQISSMRWAVTIASLILFIITLSYLRSHDHKPKAKTKTSQHAHQHQGHSKSVIQEASYDFYTILPKMNVPLSTIAKNQTEKLAQNETNKSVKPKETTYLLQLAAFKNYQEADKLKAEMTLQGFAVKIMNVRNKNNVIFYRVIIGPITNQQAVLKMQSQLAKTRLKPLLIKIDREQG